MISVLRRLVSQATGIWHAALTVALAYRAELFFWLLSMNTPLIMLALWSSVAADAPVGRFDVPAFRAYFLGTLVVRMVTDCVYMGATVNGDILSGNLSARLQRPLHPFIGYTVEFLGTLPMRAILGLPVLITFVLLCRNVLTGQALNWSVLPLAVLGTLALNCWSMLLFGSFAFYMQSARALLELWFGAFFVFGGYTIPLALLPGRLQTIARYGPFRFMVAFPVEIMLGVSTGHSLLGELALQYGYVALFGATALLVWSRGLRRYQAVG